MYGRERVVMHGRPKPERTPPIIRPTNQQHQTQHTTQYKQQNIQVDERPPPVAYACLGTALFKLDDTGASAQEALAEAAEKYPGSLEVRGLICMIAFTRVCVCVC